MHGVHEYGKELGVPVILPNGPPRMQTSNNNHPVNTDCNSCPGTDVVAVIDKRIELGDVGGGNKYRRYCFSCESWNPMSSADYYNSHPAKHVLPRDGNPDSPADIIPLSDYDVIEHEQDEIRDRVPDAALTEDPNNADDDDTDSEATDEVNEFDCPVCNTHHTGHPDSCSNCEAKYEW